MTFDAMPPETTAPVTTDLDATLLQSARWRAHALLAGHWLHSLRGMLNAMSLNLALLQSSDAAGGGGRPEQTMRGQVRDLDAALTRFLDRSELDESGGDHTHIGPLLQSVLAVVDPLSRRKQVKIEAADHLPALSARVDAEALETILMVLLVDCASRLPARSVCTVTAGEVKEGPSRIRIDVAHPLVAEPVTDPALLAAAHRILKRLGGELRRSVTADREVLSLLFEPHPVEVS